MPVNNTNRSAPNYTGPFYMPPSSPAGVTVGNEVEFKNDSGNSISVSGAAAVGSVPINPPLSVSGVDSGGLKRHIATNTLGNVLTVSAALRATVTATIAAAGSVTPSIDLTSTALLGFITSAAWTPAALNIEVSVDNTTWVTSVIGSDSTAAGSWSSITANTAYSLDPTSFLPYRYIRFRSGTSATPVNQAAARVFTVITRPLA